MQNPGMNLRLCPRLDRCPRPRASASAAAHPHGGRKISVPIKPRNDAASGQLAANASLTRLVVSLIRTAIKLASCGAAVCINYVAQRDMAEQVVADIQTADGRSIAVGADIGDPAQAATLIAQAAARIGPVTILVNNAGVVMSGTLDDYDHAAYQRMRGINYGRIVNLVSVAGIGTALKGSGFYGATKAEVIQFTKRLAMELGPNNITVNALAPGFIMTEMSREWLRRQAPGVQQSFQDRTLMAREGTPEDVAHGAAFLAAPESGWITGQVLRVDGGRMDFFGLP
jgi:NAD(P)-dependent dehydrogenase (short-subunit alcohol dehydrogenase family)